VKGQLRLRRQDRHPATLNDGLRHNTLILTRKIVYLSLMGERQAYIDGI
jgi:hypothetical protein